MTKNFLLGQWERTQRLRTRRRRDQRVRRRRLVASISALMILLLLLGLPSLMCHTPIARGMLARSAAAYGFDADADAIRIGWITPLRIDRLRVDGTRGGSQLQVAQLTAGMTVADWLWSRKLDFGELVARGAVLNTSLAEGSFGLERDLETWLATDGTAPSPQGLVRVQDLSLRVEESGQRRVWACDQVTCEVLLRPDEIRGDFSGVLTAPRLGGGVGLGGDVAGGTGSVEGSFRMAGQGDEAMRLDVRCQGLPLAFASLVRLRLEEELSALPHDFDGDAAGEVIWILGRNGSLEIDLHGVELRKVVASDPAWGTRRWQNQLMTLDGDLILTGDRVIGRRLQATTDFAAASLDGVLVGGMPTFDAERNLTTWLETLEGDATMRVDLAAAQAALPGLIPLREGVDLVSGQVHGRVSTGASGANRRTELMLRSEPLRARARGRAVVVEPIEFQATIASDPKKLTAERFRWNSSFATATGAGDPRSGSAEWEINFGRLATMLRPLVDVSETDLRGTVKGQVRWAVAADEQWTLSGEGTADDLLITMPGGRSIRRPKLTGGVDVQGLWSGDSLVELSSAEVRVGGSGFRVTARLTDPVRDPTPITPLPLAMAGQGRVEELMEILGPWLPEALVDAGGGFSFDAAGEASATSVRLASLDAVLSEPRLVYGGGSFAQPEVTMHFEGEIGYPAGTAVAKTLTVTGDAFSAAVEGQWLPQPDLEIAWRARLQRLQSSLQPRVSERPGLPIRQVSFRPGAPGVDDRWWLIGDCEGRFKIRGDRDRLRVETRGEASGLKVLQPAGAAHASLVGPQPPRRATAAPATTGSRVVWAEPTLRVDGRFTWEPTTGKAHAEGLRINGDWFAATLGGQMRWDDGLQELALQGPANIRSDAVARRLTPLAGTTIEAAGVHGTDIKLRADRSPDGDLGFRVDASLGWEVAEVAGVRLGETTVPIRWTDTSVSVTPVAAVPLDQGRLHLGGHVHYRPGPLWLQARPGLIAESVRMTPEMTHRWLKFIAPLAADATRIDGTMSITLDEAMVVFGQPELSRVSGRLDIEGVKLVSGPLTDGLIAGVQQLRSLKSLGRTAEAPQATQLVSLPAQTVEFALANNVVHHQRMKLAIDQAEVLTSGSVSLDGDLNLFAQVPLDSRWLGQDLQFLAGQSVTIPITGTLQRPSLDASGVTDLARRLGTQAAQGAAENFLLEQFDRGQQQINRGIERGMERLGIDRLFGR